MADREAVTLATHLPFSAPDRRARRLGLRQCKTRPATRALGHHDGGLPIRAPRQSATWSPRVVERNLWNAMGPGRNGHHEPDNCPFSGRPLLGQARALDEQRRNLIDAQAHRVTAWADPNGSQQPAAARRSSGWYAVTIDNSSDEAVYGVRLVNLDAGDGLGLSSIPSGRAGGVGPGPSCKRKNESQSGTNWSPTKLHPLRRL